MKRLFLFACCTLMFSVFCKSQQSHVPLDTTRVVLENDKLKVVEYYSTPGKDMCGKGVHSHVPHLTIFLTDGVVEVTTTNEKVQNFDFKA